MTNVGSTSSPHPNNKTEEAESKSRTFCRVCKKEFFGLDPSVTRKQAQANAFTHWLRHCRNTFTSELKCTNGVVWVEVNAPKRSEEDKLNDTGPPRWTCPAKFCERKYQTPRSFHEHWNRIHTKIEPSEIDGIVEMPIHRGLNEDGEDGDESNNPWASSAAAPRGRPPTVASKAPPPSNPIQSSTQVEKKTSTPKTSPKKKQKSKANEDDEDEVDIFGYDDDLSSTSDLNLEEIQKEIASLKSANQSLTKRIQSTESELEQERKTSTILRSKTHSLEIRAFSLKDELDQEKLFSRSLESQSLISKENSLKEIKSLKEKLFSTNHYGNGNGNAFSSFNGTNGIDLNGLNGDGNRIIGIDGNRLPSLSSITSKANECVGMSMNLPQLSPPTTSNTASLQSGSSSLDYLPTFKRKREGEEETQNGLEPEKKTIRAEGVASQIE